MWSSKLKKMLKVNLCLVLGFIILGGCRCNTNTWTTEQPGGKVLSKSRLPPGFQGKDCSNACPENYYGYRCLISCNCTVDEVCDKQVGCTENKTDLKRDITFRTPDNKTFEVFPEFSVTSSEFIPEHSTGHKPGITVHSGNNEETLASISYQIYLRYVGGGLAVLSLISIFGTLVLKRSGFNTKARGITLREPVIEEVSLHTIIDVGDSREQEDMYSNVYLEIIDVENGNSNPCNVYEEISGSGSSDSQSNADCCYLDVIARIEDSPIEKGFSTDDQNTEDKENYDIQFRKEDRGENESYCLTEGI